MYAALGEIRQVVCRRNEVVVIMQDHESADSGAGTYEQIHTGHRSMRPSPQQPVLGRLDPLPRSLGHGNVRVQINKHRVHLFVLVEIASGAPKFGALRLA
jgi:hypothetical protein